MSRFVLDSSALLALIDEEAGADRVRDVLSDSMISTVNLAEVYGKLDERGQDGLRAVGNVLMTLTEVVPFNEEHAVLAGRLRQQTRHAGLSLGDRACIALALATGAEVYTADSMWT